MRVSPQTPWEDCLYKHYVRTRGWLPLCETRKQIVSEKYTGKHSRRLRYFTFCGVAAQDVLLLASEKLVTPSSSSGDFDTVTFFDLDETSVAQTRKVIPNAVGFPERFEKIMLADEISTESLRLEADEPDPDDEDTKGRAESRVQKARRDFFRRFPFDIINLDLCGHVLKPSDPFPGQILNSMRRVFAWQQEDLKVNQRSLGPIDGFTLMFTTEIGPQNLDNQHVEQLANCLDENLKAQEGLAELLTARAGTSDIQVLKETNFGLFFEVAIPKLIAKLLLDEDWMIEREPGVIAFKFDRPATASKPAYSMLHFAMQVARQSPPKFQRAGGVASSAQSAYSEVVKCLFEREPQGIDGDLIATHKDDLEASLGRIQKLQADYRSS